MYLRKEPRDPSAADGKTQVKSRLAYIQIIINVVLALCCESTSPTDAGMDAFLAADKRSQSALQLKGPKGLVGDC